MRKSSLLVIIFVLLLSQFGGLPAYAEIETEGDYQYEVHGNEVTIVKYTGAGGSVVIPAKLDGLPVTGIGEEAFRVFRVTGLTSVTIPDSVLTIGRAAFHNTGLTEVVIPNSVTTIEGDAFSHNQLTSVDIPDGVVTIGIAAFYNNKLQTVNISKTVTSIEQQAFSNNELRTVNIPKAVTTIGQLAFSRNDLQGVTIRNAEMVIGQNAFFDPVGQGMMGKKPGDITISGHQPSTAETYAVENQHNFEQLKIHVKYDGNNHTSGDAPVDSQLYVKDQEVTVLGKDLLRKDGHTFSGWNTLADGSGTDYVVGGTLPMGEEEVTLYAKWTQRALDAPIVDSVADGDTTVTGIGEPGATVVVRDATGAEVGTAEVAVDGTYEVTLTRPAVGDKVLSVTQSKGEDANGDPLVSDATDVTVGPGAVAPAAPGVDSVVDGDVTVTGTGEPGANVVVTDAIGAEVGTATVDPDGTYEVTLTRPAVGNEVLSVTQSKGEAANGDPLVSDTTDVTVGPEEGDRKHTVIFMSDGVEVSREEVVSGETATVPTAPKKAGHRFDGWYKESEIKTPWDFGTGVVADTTLYAKWVMKYNPSPKPDIQADMKVDQPLSEEQLNGSKLTITVSDTSFVTSLLPEYFELQNAPKGLTVSEVKRLSPWKVEITFAFDGTKLEKDLDFGLTIHKEALTSGYKLVVNNKLPITKNPNPDPTPELEPGTGKPYTIIKTEGTFETTKVWTVKLSNAVDASIVQDALYIVDTKGNRVPVTFTSNSSTIFIQPPAGGYAKGTYTLYVTSQLKDMSGQGLKEPIKMIFTVKAVEEPEIDEMYKVIVKEGTFPSDKIWTVKFSAKIDESTLEGALLLYDEKGESIPVIFTSKGTDIIIQAPVNGYVPGTYKLYIMGKLKDISGKELKEPIKMIFTIH